MNQPENPPLPSSGSSNTSDKSKVRVGVRAIAFVEAAKGAVVLLAGFGLLALVHRDVAALAAELVDRLHLNPARKIPNIFLEAASKVTDARLWFLAGMAMIYAVFRLVEAYGLWKDRRWAEWLALGTGAIYLPIEVLEISHRTTWLKVGVLVVNLLVVAYMALLIFYFRRRRF